MARTTITRQSFPEAGFNLTDATYTTMGVGANNGVIVAYNPADVIVLNNSTGGAAVYTFKTVTPAPFSAQSLTVPDKTVTVAAGKMVLYKMRSIYRQADDSIYIDCDVAAKILVLAQ